MSLTTTNNYYNKYMKYKNKYLYLQQQIEHDERVGGFLEDFVKKMQLFKKSISTAQIPSTKEQIIKSFIDDVKYKSIFFKIILKLNTNKLSDFNRTRESTMKIDAYFDLYYSGLFYRYKK